MRKQFFLVCLKAADHFLEPNGACQPVPAVARQQCQLAHLKPRTCGSVSSPIAPVATNTTNKLIRTSLALILSGCRIWRAGKFLRGLGSVNKMWLQKTTMSGETNLCQLDGPEGRTSIHAEVASCPCVPHPTSLPNLSHACVGSGKACQSRLVDLTGSMGTACCV